MKQALCVTLIVMVIFLLYLSFFTEKDTSIVMKDNHFTATGETIETVVEIKDPMIYEFYVKGNIFESGAVTTMYGFETKEPK